MNLVNCIFHCFQEIKIKISVLYFETIIKVYLGRRQHILLRFLNAVHSERKHNSLVELIYFCYINGNRRIQEVL